MKRGRKEIDITGQRFGRLVAISKAHGSKWLFQCDCGTEKSILKGSVVSGNTKSCGCMAKNGETDITSRRFGRLTAISKTGAGKWLFRCDCGTEKEFRKNSVVSGNTKSCGCMAKEGETDITSRRLGHLTAISKTGAGKWLFRCDCGTEKEIWKFNVVSGHTKSCGCLPNKKELDITGQRFGRLVALSKADGSKWLFRCDCGVEKEIKKGSAVSGRAKSCGCLRGAKLDVDITNRRFGRLVALSNVGGKRWLFRCDCGTEKSILKGSVVSGNTKSCGCMAKEGETDIAGRRFGRLTAISKAGTGKWLFLCECGTEKEMWKSPVVCGRIQSCGCQKSQRVDIKGVRFGSFVVESKASGLGGFWSCRCDCGHSFKAKARLLRAGQVKLCPSCRQGPAKVKVRAVDSVGQRFGKLVVAEYLGSRGNAGSIMLCKCDCGGETTVPFRMLRSGNTKSCGCLKKSAERKKSSLRPPEAE